MATAASLMSDFDVYKTSTDAIVENFKKMYSNDPKQFFAQIMSVCNHFKRGLINVQNSMNATITTSYGFDDARQFSEGIDFINDSFSVLDDYVTFICTDFDDFKQTVLRVMPKDNLEYRCNIDFNLVEQLMSNLNKNVEAHEFSHGAVISFYDQTR